MPSEKPFLSFGIDAQLLRRVDDFRFTHHFPSRAAAIKWLLEAALDRGLQPEKSENR